MHQDSLTSGLSSLLWPAVNFILYVIAGIFLYRKYAAPLLRARSIQVEQELRKVVADLADAVRALTTVRNRLVNLDNEKLEIIAHYRNEGQKMAEVIVSNARKAADRMTIDVGRHIEHEFSQAKKETRRELLFLATKKAKEKLERGLSASDDRRLREQVLRQLEENRLS